MIKEKDGKFCVVSEDGTREFGCYPTKPEAIRRLSQIEFFKHKESGEINPVWLTVDEMNILCPTCAVKMQEIGIKQVNLVKLDEAGNLSGLLDYWAGQKDPGLFTKCVETLNGKEGIIDAKSLCAWLHFKATGKYPGSHRESFKESFQILESASKNGSEWDVVLIETGLSKNNNLYSEELLANSPQLFENTKAFAYEFKGNAMSLFDHLPDPIREGNPDGLTKNLVGWYDNVRFGEFKKPDGKTGKGLLAKFHVTADWLKETMRNAWKKNKHDLIAFSIDAAAAVKETVNDLGEKIKNVLSFDKIDEVTVVTEPGAGGRVLRLIASDQNKLKEKATMKEILKWLREHFPKLTESIKDDASLEEMQPLILKALQEAFKMIETQPPVTTPIIPPIKAEMPGITVQDVSSMIDKFYKDRNSEALKLSESAAMFREKVKGSNLPDAVKDKLLRNHTGYLDEAQINHILKDEQDTLAAMKESGLFVPGQEKDVKIKDEEYDKLQKAMDGMLEGADVDGIPRFHSLHESYRKCTGFDGNAEQIGNRLLQEASICLPPESFALNFAPNEAGKEWKKQLRESAFKVTDIRKLKEASTLLTTTWTELFGEGIRRKLMKEYERPNLQDWRKVVSDVSSVPDFRTNRRIRIGGFGNLANVSENGTYQYIDLPTDQEVAFAVTKRGNLYSLSYESMVNDDLGKVRNLVTKIGVAAAQTLYEFVFDFFVNNSAMDYDSTALFDLSTHANYGTVALADAALDDRIFAMMQQTEQDSSKPIGATPKYIVIPNELTRVAWEVTNATVSSSGTRTETIENWFKQFAIEIIRVDYWTDATNWYLVADPRQYPTIEVAFLNGREEPEIFIQDQQTLGSVFTADKVTVKIRHIYGGEPLDHRFMDGNVVSG